MPVYHLEQIDIMNQQSIAVQEPFPFQFLDHTLFEDIHKMAGCGCFVDDRVLFRL